ncbi:MAG: hypothetical protein NW201_10060 [Gemmatimonadales bacterium]|nr:hypothetical protein [Gemmatimonadales bacterium]
MSRVARALGALTLGALAACYALPPAPPPARPVRFLHVNDLRRTDSFPDGMGGLARLAGVRRRLLEVGSTLFVASGDLLDPEAGGAAAARRRIELFNAAGLDYATFGERDLALPADTVNALLAASTFRWLSANCQLKDGNPLDAVQPWDTVRALRRLDQLPPFPTGPGAPKPPTREQLQKAYTQALGRAAKVGIFAVSPPGDYGWVTCGDPVEAAKLAVDQLVATKADLIVALTHLDLATDLRILRADGRLDLILGGNTTAAVDSTSANRHVLKADPDGRSAQFATLWGAQAAWRSATRLIPITRDLAADSTLLARLAR